MGVPLRSLVLAALLLACSCAPLTYSEEGEVDFEKYASVRVSVVSPALSSDPARYLADELAATSGFTTVTVDPAIEVDAVLGVNLEVEYVPTVDEQGHSVDRYDGTADYTLTAGTARVDSGQATSTSSTEIDAAQGALDGVITHYVAPYRL
jgi:hypothetical protein